MYLDNLEATQNLYVQNISFVNKKQFIKKVYSLFGGII